MPSLINYLQLSLPDQDTEFQDVLEIPGYTGDTELRPQYAALRARQDFLCGMRSRGSFHTTRTEVVITTYKTEGFHVGPIPKWQEGEERGRKGGDMLCQHFVENTPK